MWKRLPDLNFNVVNHQTINISNIIYIIGGYKNSVSPNYEKITVYAIATGKYCFKIQSAATYQWDCISHSIDYLEHSYMPIDRYGHTVVVWKRMGILFGGCNDHGYCEPDIYLFVPGGKCSIINDFEGICSNDERWIKVKGIEGNAPLRRDGHSVAVVDNHMFLYGGLVCHQTRYYDNKLYQLDCKSWQWSVVYQGEYIEPIGRDFCHLLAHNYSLYLIGGRSDDCFHGNSNIDIYDTAVWSFEIHPKVRTRCWKKIHPGYGIICEPILETSQVSSERSNTIIAGCPPPRRSFMAVVLKDEIILFGGLYQSADFSVHFNDVWSYDISKNHWKGSSISSNDALGNQPVPLRKGSLTKLNSQCMILIGGVTTLNVTNDITKIISEGLTFPSCCKPHDFNLVEGISKINAITNLNRTSVTIYHKTQTPLAGYIETINDLTLRSTGHVFLLQPQISLYQKALAVVVTVYSSHQLRKYHIPSKIICDVDSIRIFPDAIW